MSNPFRSLIRVLGFINKEGTEIFHQPRLVATLVLGPFLILFLFGIGYRNEGRPLRTLFVVQDGDPIRSEILRYAPRLGPQIIFTGIAGNPSAAQKRLLKREVDLVVVAPSGAFETIRNNKQAVFSLYHNELDPYQSDYIRFTGELYVNKLNDRLFYSALKTGKKDLSTVHADLKESISAVREFRSAMDRGDVATAREHQSRLFENFDRIGATLTSELAEIQKQGSPAGMGEAEKVRSGITSVRRDLDSLLRHTGQRTDTTVESQRAAKVEQDLTVLESTVLQLAKVDSKVLVSPFASKTRVIGRTQPSLQEYFTPSVIVLLLQHLAITFSALSLVREFRLGSIELFKIAPIRVGELLLGKYLGYLIVGVFVAAALTGLLIFGLKMPMLGSWNQYAMVIMGVLIASLGLGFLLSLMSTTESQAIQYSMIVLLLSIFFSGFLLNLHMLWAPIRVVSWLLPATYGIRLMQDIMLRGGSPDPVFLSVLGLSGVGLFLVVSRLLTRRMART